MAIAGKLVESKLSLAQGIRQVLLNFIIKMFINRDGWDNAEKVSKAHVGKRKAISVALGKTQELGNDSFQSKLRLNK